MKIGLLSNRAAMMALLASIVAPSTVLAQDSEQASLHDGEIATETLAEPAEPEPRAPELPPPVETPIEPQPLPRGYDANRRTSQTHTRLAFPPSPATAVPSPPLEAGLEVTISVAPSIGLGGLAGGLGGLSPYIGGRTDFVFAVNERVFLGLGLGASYRESELGPAQFGQVDVPLIAQVYLDTPRRGEAVPTLRFVPTFRWSSEETASLPGGTTERIGGNLSFGVGISWFATEWLAVRILGSIGGGVNLAYQGLTDINFYASIGGDVGIVMRL